MPATHGAAAYTTQVSGPTTFNATAPSGNLNGALLLCFQNCDAGSLTSLTTPTGGATWLLGASLATGTNCFSKLWWKVGASEPAAYGMGQNSGADSAVTIIRVDGADITDTPSFATPAGLTTTAATINTPGVTPNSTDDIEYRFACGVGNGSNNALWIFAATTPALTDLSFVQSQSFSNHRGTYRQLTSGSATGTVTATSRNAANTSNLNQNPRQAYTVAIKSAAATSFQGWGVPL